MYIYSCKNNCNGLEIVSEFSSFKKISDVEIKTKFSFNADFKFKTNETLMNVKIKNIAFIILGTLLTLCTLGVACFSVKVRNLFSLRDTRIEVIASAITERSDTSNKKNKLNNEDSDIDIDDELSGKGKDGIESNDDSEIEGENPFKVDIDKLENKIIEKTEKKIDGSKKIEKTGNSRVKVDIDKLENKIIEKAEKKTDNSKKIEKTGNSRVEAIIENIEIEIKENKDKIDQAKKEGSNLEELEKKSKELQLELNKEKDKLIERSSLIASYTIESSTSKEEIIEQVKRNFKVDDRVLKKIGRAVSLGLYMIGTNCKKDYQKTFHDPIIKFLADKCSFEVRKFK
jgi:hypothetical protein